MEVFMSVLIIGADKLGNIPTVLEDRGIDKYTHWDGRKKGMRNMEIPTDTDMVIIFYDFVEHRLSQKVKKIAKEKNLPCVYSKRSISDLVTQLDKCAQCQNFMCCKKGIKCKCR